ncbi:tRNA(Met) cytidine acetyltransferase [Bermanella marisrubri]|uniref:tRNA(Met) cytidine acetyltransferase TmcA n=1 Tax=Bermanella marisrubri TaxID=207949 RepID=Q1N6U1_9GAMM|nr:GNAT family N-acetyltransferase [Bermanella marisrubri]EAT13501.1 hypothetical protein RED65_08924 [Oceanobacter sp. RED65] [Bermanella marisrubri]QIZ84303.1 tRNA(Met) cytidine acetyltransferase [Bermanella marisrubri]
MSDIETSEIHSQPAYRVHELHRELTASGHRSLLILAGDKSWAYALLSSIYDDFDSFAFITSEKPAKLPAPIQKAKYARIEKPNTMLGYTCSNVIVDCHDGFFPDAISAISGTIESGGIMFLLCPNLETWPQQKDAFAAKRTSFGLSATPKSERTIKRFLDIAQSELDQQHPLIIGQDQIPKASISEGVFKQLPESKNHWSAQFDQNIMFENQQHPVTLGQAAAYVQLRSIIAGHPERALKDCPPEFAILQADRGRGKSHLLGLITEYLDSESKIDNGIKYWVTAPNKVSIQAMLKASQQELEDFPFLAPENVLVQTHADDILVVDEAASLPLPLLMAWAKYFKTIIFATTTHGYEGTGKGFQIRFQEFLLKQTTSNNIQHLSLTQPIRYAENDPLENVIFSAFALQSEPKGINLTNPDLDELSFKYLSQEDLATHSHLLDDVFALLTQAHYQTRPSDLRDILDASQFSTFALFHEDAVVAVCLIAREGGFKEKDTSVIEAIQTGERRPKGHLAPQVLTLHMNQKNALYLRGARIVRIATLPQLRNQKLGSILLSNIEQELNKESLDYLASSYADTEDVRAFWHKNDFQLIRLGNKFDQSSGTRSGLVIKGLSEQGKKLQNECVQFYAEQQNIHESFKTLSRNENELLSIFIQSTGSYEAVKDILSRCKNWKEFYGERAYPKKASAEFRQLVKRWTLF